MSKSKSQSTDGEIAVSRRTALRMLAGVGVVGGVGRTRASDTQGVSRGFRLVSRLELPGARDVRLRSVDDDIAFVAGGEAGVVFVIDWANPARPQVLTEIEVPGANTDDVKVDGDLLLTNNDRSAPVSPNVPGAHFYDISDPADPVLLGAFHDPDLLPTGPHDTHLADGVAYLGHFRADGVPGGLVIVDASDPTNPQFLTEWRVEDANPELASSSDYAHTTFVQDDVAYVAYLGAGARILDISDPANPTEIAGFAEGLIRVHDIQPTPDGTICVIGGETSCPGEAHGHAIFDITDLDSPEKLAEIDPLEFECFGEGDPNGTAHNMHVRPDRLYTAEYEGGVRAFDVTDPSDPRQLGRFARENVAGSDRNKNELFDTSQWARGYVLATQRSSPDALYILEPP